MAKSENPSFFDLHVEKIVLAGCVVIVAVVAYLVFGTESTVEIQGGPTGETEVAFDMVNQRLTSAAKDLRTRIENQKVQDAWNKNYVRKFDTYADNPFPVELVQVRPFALGQRLIKYAVTDIPPADLDVLAARMPAPYAPQVQSKWLVPVKDPRVVEGQRGGRRGNIVGGPLPQMPELDDVGLAVCVSEFDLGQLKQAWSEALRDTAVEPAFVVYDQQNEVQVLNSQGQWETVAGEFRTARVAPEEPVAPVRAVPFEDIGGRGRRGFGGFERRREGEVPPEIPAFTGENFDEVWQAVEARAAWQGYFLQPDWYYYFYFPTRNWLPWQTMVSKTPAIEEYYLYLRQMKLEEKRSNLALGEIPPRLEDIELDPPMLYTDEQEGAPVLQIPYPQVTITLPAEDPMRMEEDDRDPRGRFRDDDGPYRGPRGRSRSGRGEVEDAYIASLLLGGLRLDQLPLPNYPTYLPPMEWQMEKEKLVYWFFYDQMEPGKTYRVRSRIRMINPLLGKPRDTRRPEQASQVVVASKWSQWSEPMRLPETTRFYVTGSSPSRGALQITIFRNRFSQWIAHSFELLPGQSIGSNQSKKIFNPMIGRSQQVPIDFDTDSIAVSIAFDKIVPLASGIGRIGSLDQTQELVYLDPFGMLQSRLRSEDQSDRMHQRLLGLARLQQLLADMVAPMGAVLPQR